MTVRLHIERLVVEGLELTGSETDRLRAAIEAELARNLAASPPEGWASLHVATVGPQSIGLATEPESEQIGRQVGAALYRGLEP